MLIERQAGGVRVWATIEKGPNVPAAVWIERPADQPAGPMGPVLLRGIRRYGEEGPGTAYRRAEGLVEAFHRLLTT